jgi:hypothetical protein
MAGELAHRWTGVPRISIYGLAGFLAGNLALKVQGPAAGRRRLRPDPVRARLPHQPALAAHQSLDRRDLAAGEALLTFVAVYLVAHGSARRRSTRPDAGALSMATSPATVVRVINEQKSSGQVTERACTCAR